MSFRLKRDASVSSEIRRLVSSQLEVAVSELRTVGDPESDEAVHDARRRVKKIRAVIRLVRPVLDKRFRRSIANSGRQPAARAGRRRQGIIETLDQLAHRYQFCHRARPIDPRRPARAQRANRP
jgi:hypothetical protein